MAEQSDPSKIVESRLKYANAFNDTQIRIWQDRMIKLNIRDTGALLRSLAPVKFVANTDGSVLHFSLRFLDYGVFQDSGTGREIPIGNPGDIGRAKVRKKREWLSPSFYRSYRNILEFVAGSFGQQSMAVITNGLDPNKLRKSIK